MKKILFILLLLTATSSIIVSQSSPMHDTILIKQAAMDYIEGAYSGNVDRMINAIHPELQKVIPVPLPKSQAVILQYSNYSMLVEGTRAAIGNLPEEQWNIDYELLHYDQNIATVRITSVRYQDYCHLANINGTWKIVNVLWRMNR